MKSEHSITDGDLDLGVQPTPSDRIRATIRQEISRDLHPQKPQTRGRRIAACFAATALVITSLWLLRGAFALHTAKQISVLGWAATALLVLWGGFPSRAGGQARPLRLALLLALPLAFFTYLALTSGSWHGLSAVLGGQGPSTTRCAVEALGLGALGATAIAYVWRRSDPFTPNLTGGLVGVLGGMSGALAMGLVCPGDEAWHLTLGHGSALAILAAIGALLGPRILSP